MDRHGDSLNRGLHHSEKVDHDPHDRKAKDRKHHASDQVVLRVSFRVSLLVRRHWRVVPLRIFSRFVHGGWVEGLLKAEIKRRNVTYSQLFAKLEAIGVVDSEPNIRNKISRGKFTAVFFLQCLEAIGANTVRLD